RFEQPCTSLLFPLFGPLLLSFGLKRRQTAERDEGGREGAPFRRRTAGRAGPMVTVRLIEQQVLRDGTRCLVRLPFPQLQRHQRMASSVRLTSLSLPLQILC